MLPCLENWRMSPRVLGGILVAFTILPAIPVAGADWPQWRHDAGRGASTSDELPPELHLQWTRRLPLPRPAWPESQPWLRFDVSYAPVAAGRLLFVPSMVTDSVTAYDTQTGRQRWQFFADGPVRFAPIAHEDRVYFASDDGCLYCLAAGDGRLLWRFRGGPSDRNVLGNRRLISTWPIRGGPVLLDGTVYFTAGIWPFMGVFVHAVDARTGKSVWTNSGDSCPYVIQPHRSPAFSGFVPRGYIAATRHGLVIPGGRTPAACYDLKTGRQLHWLWTHKGSRASDVAAYDRWYFASGMLYQIADGKVVLPAASMVHDDDGFYTLFSNELVAAGFQLDQQPVEKPDKDVQGPPVTKQVFKDLWKVSVDEDCGRLMLKAGDRFYAGKAGRLTALVPNPGAGKATISWRQPIDGDPWAMLAADDKLFVVTDAGDLYCFGDKTAEPVTYDRPTPESSRPASDPSDQDAHDILQAAGMTEGYALVLGLGTGRLAESLVRGSKLHVIAIDPDPAKVDEFRRRMTEAGLYGTRVAARVGDPVEYSLPPYLATVVASEDVQAAGIDRGRAFFEAAYRTLRPYGGTACLPLNAESLRERLAAVELAGAEVKPLGEKLAVLVRPGPLPGAADWTHQYADAANTVVSQDSRIKAPLGLLWFGGPPNDEVLPRHGHGPSPQVAAGRLFIEGPDMLRALDIYTGRLLWQAQLPKLGHFYDNTSHQPGAGEIGSNYVSLPDAVYVAYADAILRLDASTGGVLQQFRLPAQPGKPEPRWGYLGAFGDFLVATSTPIAVDEKKPSTKTPEESGSSRRSAIEKLLAPVPYASTSRRLVVMERYTGAPLWDRTGTYGFRHNNIALGAGRLFCIDGLSAMQQRLLLRRGIDLAPFPARLLALDLRTGKELWSTSENVTGTFLGYSAEHDILLQAGSAARDRAADEARTGMIAYRGDDGQVLWQDLDRSYSGPCMLHGDTIITQSAAFRLLTGEPVMRKHPLTGEPVPWQYKRNYGCNTVIACRNLLTFRSAAAGFFDLERDGGTGNLGGFKSSCTSNLVAAGGLLNAPEYTRTCTCNYQNQTSLAMVHDPDVEMWTFNNLEWDGKPVRRVGINFGAPGNRRTDNGTLWLDWPSVGGPSPDLPLKVAPDDVETFRIHSSLVHTLPGSGDLPWVAASGLEGVRRVTLTLAKDPAAPRTYTVRLHFMEPREPGSAPRVFRVLLQGTEVLPSLNVAAEAGSTTALVKEFRGIEIRKCLSVELDPVPGGSTAQPILCGLEAVAESATVQHIGLVRD